jgi:hypothetical protein
LWLFVVRQAEILTILIYRAWGLLLQTSHFYPNWETPFFSSSTGPATVKIESQFPLGCKNNRPSRVSISTHRAFLPFGGCSESVESGLFRGEGMVYCMERFVVVAGQQFSSRLPYRLDY